MRDADGTTASETDAPDTVAAAHDYIARGWSITPVKYKDKKPVNDDWTNLVIAPEDVDAHFGKATRNIGVILGVRSGGLVDIDLDCPAANALADYILPHTATFGRPSTPKSHRLYIAEGAKSVRYQSPDGKTLIEIRSTGAQTVFPNSTHKTGEPITWCSLVRDPVKLSADQLESWAGTIAAGSLLVHVWPAEGSRQDFALALAGFLLQGRVSESDAERFIETVARVAGDDEVSMRVGTVNSTAKTIEGGDPVKGGGALRDMLGDKAVRLLRKWLRLQGVKQTVSEDSETIVMRGGQLVAIVDKAELALLDKGAPIYQRGSELVRPMRLDRSKGKETEVRRQAGAIVLLSVREPWLLEQMSKSIGWARLRNDKLIPADPDQRYARTLLGRAGEWRFPGLRGVATAPTLDRGGRVVELSGFDAPSGLLLDFEDGAFPRVPEAPTKTDADAAMARLAKPLRGFPFIDDAARSVALSALLTALIRPALRTSPLHGFDAPTAGTGKTKLAEMPGLLAMGTRPAAMSQGKTDEEDEKRLSTVLYAGDPVILIDNCERELRGDFLCSMLTQETVQARILGLSERRLLPCTALVLATGNNLTFAGDVSRRVVSCRLDAKVERPDERVFDFDAQAELMADRPALVVAGLTALRAYRMAEQPLKGQLRPMGSFEDWSWVRETLVWLGYADPSDTRETIFENDPRKGELATVMDEWERRYGDRKLAIADIFDAEMRERLAEAACFRGGGFNARSVGWWLRRNADKVVNGRCFRREDRGRTWRLEGAGPATEPDIPM